MNHRSPSFIGSCSSLPSVPEHEIYRPPREFWNSLLLSQRGGEEQKSKKVAIGVLIAASLLLLSSIVLSSSGPDSNNRRLAAGLAFTRTVLFDDGTLYSPQNSKESLCEYFTQTTRQHTKITKIHVHFEELSLNDFLGAKLIADAAQVPLHLSEEFGVSVSSLRSEALTVGERPSDHGKIWSVNQLCHLCTQSLCQDYLHLVPDVKHRHIASKLNPKNVRSERIMQRRKIGNETN